MLCLTLKERNGVTFTLPDGRKIRIERGHGQQVKIDAPRDVEIARDGAKKKTKDVGGDR